jgi:5'-3' exonuclease
VKLHLIDGTYELFRSYFGAPKSRAADGQEIGAARGLLRSLAALLREPDCSHVAIAFDHVIESFRNDMFDGYKTGEGIEPDLLSQFPIAEEIAEALGIVVWPMVDFEADDALATAAARFAQSKEVEQVRICSPDKDLAQCVVGDRIVLLDRMRNRVIDEEGVKEKWGVEPASIPDYLALVGDAADGIPGIPRWGQKSASKLLAHYGAVSAIPELPDRWAVKVRGAAGLAEKLNAQREDAALYRELAILRTDVPLEEELDDLRWQGAHRGPLDKIGERVRDPNIAERVPKFRD